MKQKTVDLSGDPESTVLNPGQRDVSIHGCTYTPTHIKRHTPTYIILTIKIANSNCLPWVLHKDWF